MTTSGGRRALLTAACALAVAVGGVALPVAPAATAATAATAAATPAKPAGVRVVAVTGSGFTVALRSSRHATRYRLWTSTTRSRLALATIRRTQASPASASPRRVSISRLGYTAAPYYFRVQAIGRGTSRFSGVYSTTLRSAAPTGLRATSSKTSGLALTWSGRAAARYQVQQATDAGMSRGQRTWTTRSVAQTFTPYGLTPGTRYWFRVRSSNGSSTSAWSAPTSAVAASRGTAVRVMTYNVLKADRVGSRYPSGERVAAWSQRGPKVVAGIRASRAQVVGLQEAAGWTDRSPSADGPGVRQADWIRARLGGRWQLASTEVAPGEKGWKRTGRYVLFDGSRFSQVAAGTWVLVGGSNPTKVAWAVLRENATGARFVVTSSHLYPQTGSANDRRRKLETERLVGRVDALRSAHDAQAVYLGDFNSAADVKHPLDGPGVAFRAARVARADHAATSLSPTARFNSANQLSRTPPAKAVHVDAVWAPAGVGVRSWTMVLALSGGRFAGAIPSDHNPVLADVVLPY